MEMPYKLVQEKENGKVMRLSLGISEVDTYLKFIQYRCRPNTWISYGYDLQVFLNTFAKPLGEITPLDIMAFIENQKETPRRRAKMGKGHILADSTLSNRTIKRRLTTISGLYEYLRVFQLCSLKNNPVPKGLTKRTSFWGHRFSNSAVTPLIRAPEELPHPLDAEEINRFADSLRHHRDKAILLLMLLAGLRKSEVMKLNLKDINFGQHTLFVRDGKGGFQRTVAISDAGLKEVICYLKKERPASSSDRIFLVLKGPHRGQPLSLKGLDTIVAYHRRKADTPGLQCHRLRHTCFTQLRQSGMSLEAIQAQAGHRSIETTRIYLHLCPKELQQEYLKMSQTLFNLPPANGRSGNG
jgi:integrase/recombinase XerD